MEFRKSCLLCFLNGALSSCVDSVFDVIAKSLAEATSKEYWQAMVIKRTFSIVNELIYDGMCIAQEMIQVVDLSIIEI